MTAGAAKTELNNGTLSHIPGHIPPTAHRGWWIFAGLVLQLAGVGGPAAYVWTKAKHQDVGGLITVATVKLAWHQSLHAKAGIAILVGGAAVFAIGSIALARPFAKHWLTLFVGVPIAALCGALVLGAAALVIALLVFLFLGGGDIGGFGGGGSGGSSGGKRKSQPETPPQAPAGSYDQPADQPGGFSA
ncbi:hypothetical protein [Catenulispora pinisilvae]|uniref:hypothetical protein n=1 Tax=Catenulispora pinisilvae TaxID=2705253 RepID=UPI0018928376|nr:hypothetical protein [Catenulispora pinisilvae]